jgi:hypothetical protein
MTYSSTEIRATDFAITTVNVPDRLDLRDMDDRKQVEDDARQRGFDMHAFRVWAPRLFFVGILAVAAFVLFEGIETWRTSLSAAQLSQRLSVAFGVPVQIETSRFAISPTPRLALTKVSIDGKLVLNEVSINIGTRHIAQVFQGHGWNWGEAVVGPTSLTLEQCLVLLNLLPKLDAALPKSLSALRFDRLELAEQPWFTGPWEVGLTRDGSTGFSAISAEQRGGAHGSVQFQLVPTSAPDTVSFQVQATNWLMPFGPSFPIEEVVASGQASPTHLEVSEFSVGGPFGAVQGSIAASLDGNWSLDGVARTEGLDLEALIHQIAPPPTGADNADAASASTVIQGMASFTGHIAGKGQTLAEAVATAAFEAPVHVRWPVLNGINLGYVATRPGATGGTNGGSTRFSGLDTVVMLGTNQVSFREIRAHAGALAAYGQVNMAANHALSGMLHVDLGTTRVLAPIRVMVHGTVVRPEFGR